MICTEEEGACPACCAGRHLRSRTRPACRVVLGAQNAVEVAALARACARPLQQQRTAAAPSHFVRQLSTHTAGFHTARQEDAILWRPLPPQRAHRTCSLGERASNETGLKCHQASV